MYSVKLPRAVQAQTPDYVSVVRTKLFEQVSFPIHTTHEGYQTTTHAKSFFSDL